MGMDKRNVSLKMILFSWLPLFYKQNRTVIEYTSMQPVRGAHGLTFFELLHES